MNSSNECSHCISLIQQLSRPLRSAPYYKEFKKNHAMSSELTLITNYQTRDGRSIDLILDTTCLTKFNISGIDEIDLHIELGYYCCEHVFHHVFTCNDKIFFKRAPPGQGQPICSFRCPFNDAGRACSN